MRYVAVDWSGSLSIGGSEIWLAVVEAGELRHLHRRLTRVEVTEMLVAWQRAGVEMMVGLDFAFSMPAWFVEHCGAISAPEFWRFVEQDGERWLADCPPPFWGKPGRRRHPTSTVGHRRTELSVRGRPKSVFQVGGAGAVGTGSIRGMPLLRRLRAGGLAIWPFDPPSPSTAIEIYPRLLTGPGPKRQHGWRSAYLDALQWPADLSLRAAAATTEDSFDAAVSALRMWEARAELARLEATADPVEMREGRIWEPGQPLNSVAVGTWSRAEPKQSSRPAAQARSK